VRILKKIALTGRAIVVYTQIDFYCAKSLLKPDIRYLHAQRSNNNLLIIITNNILYKNTTT